jgi:integrase/recombinase XerD
MNTTQKQIKEVIKETREAMARDAISEDYIKSLSCAWNALLRYVGNENTLFSEKLCWLFLSDQYGIDRKQNYLALREIDKRRKRAIFVLINTWKYGNTQPRKSYHLCRFSCKCKDEFSAFLEYRKKQQYSITTINKDIYSLNKFSTYMEASLITSVRQIDSSYVVGFIKWLSTEGKVPILREVASTMRLLLDYLYKENMILENLSGFVPKVKVRKDLIPSVYTPDEVESMLQHIDRSSPCGKRDYAMVLLAARYGIRASDISALLFENIHWNENTINFSTVKTGKHTVLPLTGEIGNAIIQYLKYGRPNTEEKHVFIRLQKPYREIQPSNLHGIVTRAMRSAGIVIQPGKRHGPHALRASIATEMLKQNVPLPVISEALSHNSTDTTKIYMKVDVGHLKILSLNVPPLGNVWMGGAPI